MGKTKKGNEYKVRNKIKKITVVGTNREYVALVEFLRVFNVGISRRDNTPGRSGRDELLIEVVRMGDKRFAESALFPGWSLVEAQRRYAMILVDDAYDTQIEAFARDLQKVFFSSPTKSPRRETFERMLDIVFPNGELQARLSTYMRIDHAPLKTD